MNELGKFLFPSMILLFFVYRFFQGLKIKKTIPFLISKGAVIIDVRSTPEFLEAANPKSINIPLDRISQIQSTEIAKERPIILCCASGMRSGMAVSVLKRLGYENVINGGPWKNTLQ